LYWLKGVIDACARCVSAVAQVRRTRSGFWSVETLDPRQEARELKRSSRAKVGAQVAAFDERGVKARHAEAERRSEDGGLRTDEQYGFQEAAPSLADTPARQPVDWAALEEAAGVLVS
jgi:hypothetical protein